MDSLDKQLAELQLLSELQKQGTLGKKIGPAVPPKPKKTQPQVSITSRRKYSLSEKKNSIFLIKNLY